MKELDESFISGVIIEELWKDEDKVEQQGSGWFSREGEWSCNLREVKVDDVKKLREGGYEVSATCNMEIQTAQVYSFDHPPKEALGRVTVKVNEDLKVEEFDYKWMSEALGGRCGYSLEEITECRDLQMLELEYQKLTELPPEIGELRDLRYLIIRGNSLTQLPPEIGKLKNLEYLDLCLNRLTALPAEIGELRSLWKLDLRSNQLTRLPVEIRNLTNLRYLYLGNNKFSKDEKSRIREFLPRCRVSFWFWGPHYGVFLGNLDEELEELEESFRRHS
jgi:hypothetical protein